MVVRALVSLSIVLAVGLVAARLCGAEDLRYSAAGDGGGSLFQFAPETPQELLEAASLAVSLDRPADARVFLRQLLERDSQSPEMQTLRQRFGLSLLMDFRRDVRLQPEAGQLLKHMQGALPRLSSAELAERASRLGTGLASAAAAELDLLAAGPAAVPVLLAQDPSTPAGRAAGEILQSLAFDWRHDLAALLPGADPATRPRILGLLAGSAAHDLQETLLRYRFTTTDPGEEAAAAAALRRLAGSSGVPETAAAAVQSLLEKATLALEESARRTFAVDPAVAAVGQPSGQQAPLQRASWLLDHALAIQPENSRGLLLRDLTAASAANAALDAPSGPSAALSPARKIELLDAALQAGLSAASLDVLKSLDPETLAAGDLRSQARAALRAALDSPDARIRTLAAILLRRSGLITPQSARAAQIQISFATSRPTRPEAVVIIPDGQVRLQFRHLLEDRGFQADSAGSGPDGFLQAAAQLQCELIVLSLQPSKWTPAMTIANLRADRRTRSATIVLIGPPTAARQAEALIQDCGNAVFLEEPVGPLTFDSRLSMLRLPPPVISAEDRAALRQQADALSSGR